MRVYHAIPTSGEGTEGVNYDQTQYGYDVMKRRNQIVSPGGTITFEVFDVRGLAVATYVGTNDDGATETDTTGGGADPDNNMVVVTENEYDHGTAGGDGNLTQITQYATATDTRVTTFLYDWRNRRTDTDGEIDFYETLTYDNLDRVIRTERFDTTASGNLVARHETLFDNRGRVYRTIRYGVDPATGAVGNSLADNTWFDASGNEIKQIAAGANQLATKTVYDGLNRATIRYVGYDLSETAHTDAGDVVGDTILEQAEFAFDDAGNTVMVTACQRYHNTTGTGPLNGPAGLEPKARVTYSASWPDAVGRTIASAEYGTNGGTALVRPATIPARSDTVLVTSNEFDDAGRTSAVTDPAGTVTRTEYDDADRRTALTENFVDGVVSAAAPDEDRTTRWTYTPDGTVATLTAVNPDTGDQVTTYIYGTTLADSEIARSDLLRAEVYPDSTGGSDRVEYAYNRQGQRTGTTDQTGTVRAFDYDKRGRPTQDRVTMLGGGVDGAVRRIATTYEVRGLPETVTSYDNATVGAGNIVNEIQFAYNGFAQLVIEYQAHAGTVNTGTTPRVQYGYADGSANTIRPVSITYPDGRVLDYDYGTTGGIDDVAGRVASITDGTTQLVGYAYLGAGTIVETDYQEPDLRYRLFDPLASGDINTGLDRFGRVIDCRWEDYGSSTDAVQIRYGYDRASNRLWREDVVATTQGKHFDELYAYDGLYRLADMQRGTLNAQKDAVTNKSFAQGWLLDPTGNWGNFKQDDNGDGTWNLDQDRTANKVNEITGITETTGPSWVTPAYDPAGNMMTMPQPTTPSSSYGAAYDAWNRLVKLVDGVNTVQENIYDGLRRRTVRKDYASGALDETRHFYYSDSWQAIEERLNASTDPDRQFVWGLRYVDELLLRDRDTDGNGTLDERLYVLQDANWNVTAVIDGAGDVQERYAYQPYGQPLFLGTVFDPQSASGFDWETLLAGYRWDQTTALYLVRNRILHPTVGGWMQRDPIMTWHTFNLYQYALSLPTRFIDPTGLISEESADSDDGDDMPADPCSDCKKTRDDYFKKHGNTYKSEKADRTCRVNIRCSSNGCGESGAAGCGLTEGPRKTGGGGRLVIKICVSSKCGAPSVILAHELAHMRDLCDGEMNRNCGECFKFERSGAEAGCKEAKKTNKDLDMERCIQCAVNISCGARFGSMCQPYPNVDPKKCTCADLGVPPGCGI